MDRYLLLSMVAGRAPVFMEKNYQMDFMFAEITWQQQPLMGQWNQEYRQDPMSQMRFWLPQYRLRRKPKTTL
jgi:hypothetical protein